MAKWLSKRRQPDRLLRAWPWPLAIIASLVLLLFIAAFLIDEPLRRYMEEGMNEALDGYSVRLGEVDFHLIGLSITVKRMVLRQDANPEPAVAVFPRLDASIQWRELLTGNLVSNWRLEQPQLHINLQQLQQEDEDETPVEERGWREALIHIYPVKINRLEIEDGSLTYIDQDPEHPLQLTNVDLSAGNIRNTRSPPGAYPSPLHLEADIFQRGHGTVEGSADFLADPHPAIKAGIRLQEVPLERLGQVTSRANVFLAGGILSGNGEVEYAPEVKRAHLADLTIDGLQADYVHSARTAEAEERRARKAKQALEDSRESEWQFLVEKLHLTRGDFGFVNQAQTPDYRISLSNSDLQLRNLSNRFRAGEAQARLQGTFMHSGEAVAEAAFRPEQEGADFDLLVAIEGTRVSEMNDLLRAHADLDVVAGSFSVYSELSVRDGRIDGYVRPLFKDLDIYDPQQEKDEGLIDKLKEGVAGALAQLLENPQEKVATEFDLSGPVDDPEASSWQIVLQMIRNAFFDAILPGFRERGEGETAEE